MKKKLVILGIIAILVFVGLSGCNQQTSNTLSPKKSKFVGTWHNSTTVNIDLFSDGTCKFQSINGTWNLKNDKLVLIFTDYSITYNYVFSNNNQTLTLTDIYEGATFNVTKQ
jgi:hypothetical protein